MMPLVLERKISGEADGCALVTLWLTAPRRHPSAAQLEGRLGAGLPRHPLCGACAACRLAGCCISWLQLLVLAIPLCTALSLV